MGIVKGSTPSGDPYWYDDVTGQQIDPNTGQPMGGDDWFTKNAPPLTTQPVGPKAPLGGNGGTTPPTGFNNTSPVKPTGPAQQPFTPQQTTFSTGADATNGFGGVTYAGFNPQDHQGANLFDPMNAKYALQQYMVQNGALSGGANGNAQQIADALNKMYGSAYGNPNFFKASDAETIMMPDGQYVHAADNGYGMAKGTFDPSNKSEVFWGYTGGDNSGGTGTPASSGTPASGSGSYNYQQALAKVQGATGQTLSPAQINSLFSQFGGDQNSTFTDASLAPVIAYVQGQNKPQQGPMLSASSPSVVTSNDPVGPSPNMNYGALMTGVTSGFSGLQQNPYASYLNPSNQNLANYLRTR